MTLLEEKTLIDKIRNNDEKAFEKLFYHYYQSLCLFATQILTNNNLAEEMVQNFFVKFWEKRSELYITTSLKSYFLKSVKNQCLNHIKHEKIKLQHANKVISEAEKTDFSPYFIEVDLQKDIEKSIAALPEKRQEIFRLSREEGLKYREISEKLNISVKTVETQMRLAIQTLREKLSKYL